MPMYGLPAGLLGFMGAGAGAQQGGFGALGGALQAFGQAEAAQADRGDRELQGLIQIARMNQEISAAEEARALQAQQAEQEAERQQAQQAYVQSLPQEQQAIAGAFPQVLAKQQAQAMFREPDEPDRGTSMMQNLAAAGLQPGTPEYQQAVMDALTKPSVQINQPKLEAGMIPIDPTDLSKGVRPQPGGSKDPMNPRNFTGEQRKAAGFADRMIKSQGKLREMEQSGYNPASVGEVARGRFGRPAQTKEGKAYQDFQDNFIRAILRKESGAAITAEERSDYGSYFPQLGDTAEDIARKAAIRDELAGGVAAEAGPAYDHIAAGEAQKRAKKMGVSMSDVEYTAQQEGMTVQQVLDELER